MPTILAIPIHRDEKSRFDRAVKRIMLEAPAACAETTQMYRLRLPKLGASVMALMRTRFVIVEEGSYLAAVFSFAPLPSKPSIHPSDPAGLLLTSHLRKQQQALTGLSCVSADSPCRCNEERPTRGPALDVAVLWSRCRHVARVRQRE